VLGKERRGLKEGVLGLLPNGDKKEIHERRGGTLHGKGTFVFFKGEIKLCSERETGG